MTRTLAALVAVLLSGGCDCHGVGLEGDGSFPGDPADDVSPPEDSADTPTPDAHDVADLSDVSEAEVDAAPPCWDEDDDGHPAAECGGDDCDDDDPLVHPGAPDACADGIDSDCDGFDPPATGIRGDPVLLRDDRPRAWPFRGRLAATTAGYAVAWGEEPDAPLRLRGLDRVGTPAWDDVAVVDGWRGAGIAGSGTRVGVAWVTEPGDDVVFRVFAAGGEPLSDAVVLTPPGARPLAPDCNWRLEVLALADGFVVFWVVGTGTVGAWGLDFAVVDTDGTRRFGPVAIEGEGAGAQCDGVSATADGGEIGVVWSVGPRVGGTGVPWFRRVGADGSLRSAAMRVGPEDAGLPLALLRGAEEYALVWQLHYDLTLRPQQGFLTRFEPTGSEIARVQFLEAIPGSFLACEATGVPEGYGLLCRDNLAGEGFFLRLLRLRTDGTPLGEPILHGTWDQPLDLDLVWTGGELAALWKKSLVDTQQLWFARFGFCD